VNVTKSHEAYQNSSFLDQVQILPAGKKFSLFGEICDLHLIVMEKSRVENQR
jgi:hypothetical protein